MRVCPKNAKSRFLIRPINSSHPIRRILKHCNLVMAKTFILKIWTRSKQRDGCIHRDSSNTELTSTKFVYDYSFIFSVTIFTTAILWPIPRKLLLIEFVFYNLFRCLTLCFQKFHNLRDRSPKEKFENWQFDRQRTNGC